MPNLKMLITVNLLLSVSNFMSCCTPALNKGESNPAMYYDQYSKDNNAEYDNSVTEYFKNIGKVKTIEEIKEYTAAVFIASIPPLIEIYENDEYVGKTNIGLLYFKPGFHKLLFKTGHSNWYEELTLTSGKNPSILTKKR